MKENFPRKNPQRGVPGKQSLNKKSNVKPSMSPEQIKEFVRLLIEKKEKINTTPVSPPKDSSPNHRSRKKKDSDVPTRKDPK